MKSKYLSAMMLISLLAAPDTALTQHHERAHEGRHRREMHSPAHDGVHFGHPTWRHVVPQNSHFVGGYYSVGTTHYYTPTTVTRIVVPANPVTALPTLVEGERVEVPFGGYRRYEDLARRLTFEANNLCLELHYNYAFNAGFDQVYREAYDIMQAGRYLHGKDHGGDRNIIRMRIVEVDKSFHHFQQQIHGWGRVERKLIGAGDLSRKVADVEAVLHHLCYDIGVTPHQAPVVAHLPLVDGVEAAPPPKQ